MFTRPLQVSHFERKFTALRSDYITKCKIGEKIHLHRGKLHRWQNIVPSGLPRHSTQTASVSKQGPQTAGLSSRITWENLVSLQYFDNDIFPWWWWWGWWLTDWLTDWFGSWDLNKSLALCTDFEHKVCSRFWSWSSGVMLRLKFGQYFAADVWLRLRSFILVNILQLGLVKISSLDLVEMLMFGWDFEVNA